jgi:hypothetical protein
MNTFFRLLISIVILTAGFSLHAEAPPTALQSAMRKMSQNLKSISLQINDPSQNESSIAMTKEFLVGVKAAKLETPPIILNMPADRQEAARSHFHERLDQVIALGEKLLLNLQGNDNPAAAENIRQLGLVKRDGHSEFIEH